VTRVRMLAYGVLGFAAVIVVYLIVSSGGGGGYIVRAEFRDVDGLRDGATVKVDGVPAGIVTSITVTRRDTAIATLKLDPAAAPIGAGASVQERPTDLLGEHYAQLNVGNLSKPQPSGTFIPISRTGVSVELDDILNMLDVDTRTRLRILIDEAGIGLAGRGADFNTLLSDLPPDLSQAQQLLAQVASQNATMENLISEGDQITAAVNGKRNQLGNLIDVADQALGAVAARQSELGATIARAPGALTQLRTTLNQLGTASEAITPAAQSLQATSGPLTATLRALPPFTNAADPTLVTARHVAPDLERLGREARPPVKALRPTALNLQSVTRSAVPILDELDQRGMRDLLWFIENWALALKGRDALGHFVGANFEIDSSILISALDSYLNDSGLVKGLARGKASSAASIKNLLRAAAPAPASSGAPSSSGVGSSTPTVGGGLGAVSSAAGAVTKTVTQTVGALTGAGATQGQGSAPPSSSSSPAGNAQRLLDYLLGE
jgi:ABC-type transporter Mla subunit MlaD